MLCLFLIETSFALSRLDRRSPSLIFDLSLSVGNFHSFFLAFLKDFLHAFSLWFLSSSPLLIVGPFFLAFPFYPLILLVSSKYLLFAPSVGCDPSQGFF